LGVGKILYFNLDAPNHTEYIIGVACLIKPSVTQLEVKKETLSDEINVKILDYQHFLLKLTLEEGRVFLNL